MSLIFRRSRATQTRSSLLTLDDLGRQIELLNYAGNQYMAGFGRVGSYRREEVQLTSEDIAYSASGVAFAVVGRRMDLFSQVRFAWRRPGAGPRPMASDLYTDKNLAPVDDPAELLSWMELDQALAGNSFVVRDGASLRRLVPWWVTVVVTSERHPEQPELAWDARVAGYLYQPPGGEPEVFLADEVAHYYNRPDPAARWRGMSYLRPVLRNVANTEGYERYISQYWSNAAVPNVWITFPPEVTQATVLAFADLFEEKHAGLGNAWRTAYLGGGADPKVLGSKLSELAASEVTANEFSTICAAAGVPPVVATIVPGLEAASTYANYKEALRAFADLTVRPLWAKAAASLTKLLDPRDGRDVRILWPDPSGISALQADAQDDAQVMAQQAQTMRTLGDAGWEPESVKLAVTTGDMTKLKHSGYFSVQLLPPNAMDGSGQDGEASTDASRAQDQALTLQRLYLPLNSEQPVIDVNEARRIATLAGGVPLTGPPPAKTVAPSPPVGVGPPPPIPLGTGDDDDDEDEPAPVMSNGR